MCPRKDRERMPAAWVIPGWTETNKYFSLWQQKCVHNAQYRRWVCEMLEGIDRNNDFSMFLGRRGEYACILNTCHGRFLPCSLQKVLANVDADDALGTFQGHFNGLSPFTTPEIDYGLPYDLIDEFAAQQKIEL